MIIELRFGRQKDAHKSQMAVCDKNKQIHQSPVGLLEDEQERKEGRKEDRRKAERRKEQKNYRRCVLTSKKKRESLKLVAKEEKSAGGQTSCLNVVYERESRI